MTKKSPRSRLQKVFLKAERQAFLLKTSMKYYICQLARQRATVIIVADVNDDPIEYNREKPTADAWAFPY
jgi:hypothetical protein